MRIQFPTGVDGGNGGKTTLEGEGSGLEGDEVTMTSSGLTLDGVGVDGD